MAAVPALPLLFARPAQPGDTTTAKIPPSPTTAASRAQRPQKLSPRTTKESPYQDFPLIPLPSLDRPVTPSLRPPEPSTYRPGQLTSRPNWRKSRGERSSFVSLNLHSPARRPSPNLWNPINYVPRTVAVDSSRGPAYVEYDLEAQRDASPLLTVPERRRSRQQPSPTSLFVERSVGDTESGRTSVGLPRGHRRSGTWDNIEMGDNQENGAATEKDINGPDACFAPNESKISPAPHEFDNEVPRHVEPLQPFRSQTVASFPSAPGNNSTHDGRGDFGEPNMPEELAWGPSHPCFPHMNPHVAIDSAEYASTRIIRIRRDWMIKGDLAPTFSNLYPEILDPLLPEQEFRAVIAKINEEVTSAFDPLSLRNWVDNVLGVLTGWIWDDLGLTGVKSRLRSLENWIQSWNRRVGAPEGVKIWALRTTGYMCLDIQIPDPKVRVVDSEPASVPGTRPSTSDIR